MIETRRGPTHEGAACEKMEEKTISSGVLGGVHLGRGDTFLYTGGEESRRREGERRGDLPRKAFTLGKTSRCHPRSFHKF